jgi:RNA polymerase primary sigma factor
VNKATATASSSSSEDLVRVYLRDIGRRPLLAQEQEVSLAKAIEAGARAARRLGNGSVPGWTERRKLNADILAGEAARRVFVEANLRLVVSVARRYQGFGLPLLDLIQEGNLGLLRAVDKFDWRRGFKFSTYAVWWIRQAISRGLADRSRSIRLPVHVAEMLNRMRRTESDLSRELGREPTDEEVAAALGVDAEQVQRHRMLSLDPISLSLSIGEDTDTELIEMLVDESCDSPLDEAIRATHADDVRDLLGSLTSREQRILELRFGFDGTGPRTLEQVGVEFGLTRERIRQIEAKAMAKLRHPAREREVRSLLD